MAEPLAVYHSLNSIQSSCLFSNKFLNFYTVRSVFLLQIGMLMYEHILHHFIQTEFCDTLVILYIFEMNFRSTGINLKIIGSSSAGTETPEAGRGVITYIWSVPGEKTSLSIAWHWRARFSLVEQAIQTTRQFPHGCHSTLLGQAT